MLKYCAYLKKFTNNFQGHETAQVLANNLTFDYYKCLRDGCLRMSNLIGSEISSLSVFNLEPVFQNK